MSFDRVEIRDYRMAAEIWVSWINILLVLALVAITAYYAKKTADILEESRKSRQAAERQASAAEASVLALRQRLEEEAGLGRTTVAAAIQSATRTIEYWGQANVMNLAATGAIPANIDLLSVDYQLAVQHARRISVNGSVELAGAFDQLRIAQTEIQILPDVRQTNPIFYQQHAQTVGECLRMARLNLETATALFS